MNNLVKIRSEKGLNQSALADKIGVTRAGMSFIEKKPLSTKNAKKIADVLDVNVFELLGTDLFKILPKTKEDKKAVEKILRSI